MKTANEMRQFAQQYVPDRLFKENPAKVDFEKIANNLNADEDVLFAFVAHAGRIADNAICRVGIALSKDRLLLVYKPNTAIGIFCDANCKTYDLKEVNSIGAQGLCVEISIRAEGNVILGNWSGDRRNLIAKEIRKIIEVKQTEKEGLTIVNSVSTADELRKYKELLNEGIITQEEFDAKKKQLLNL